MVGEKCVENIQVLEAEKGILGNWFSLNFLLSLISEVKREANCKFLKERKVFNNLLSRSLQTAGFA